MKIIRKQSIENGIYSISIRFKEFGRKDLTPEQEKEVIKNFGLKISYKDIDFKGYFKFENGTIIKTDDKSTGDEVVLNLNNVEIFLDEKLDINYSVKASQLDKKIVGTHLNTNEKLAYAMCILFADKIEESINKEILSSIEKSGDFEKEEEKTL